MGGNMSYSTVIAKMFANLLTFRAL
jgi:hypothetical protein